LNKNHLRKEGCVAPVVDEEDKKAESLWPVEDIKEAMQEHFPEKEYPDVDSPLKKAVDEIVEFIDVDDKLKAAAEEAELVPTSITSEESALEAIQGDYENQEAIMRSIAEADAINDPEPRLQWIVEQRHDHHAGWQLTYYDLSKRATHIYHHTFTEKRIAQNRCDSMNGHSIIPHSANSRTISS